MPLERVRGERARGMPCTVSDVRPAQVSDFMFLVSCLLRVSQRGLDSLAKGSGSKVDTKVLRQAGMTVCCVVLVTWQRSAEQGSSPDVIHKNLRRRSVVVSWLSR